MSKSGCKAELTQQGLGSPDVDLQLLQLFFFFNNELINDVQTLLLIGYEPGFTGIANVI